MSYQVIEQPDGQLAVFSTSTDTIVVYDATAEEIVEWFTDMAAARARGDAQRAVKLVQGGQARKVYHQFTMTWIEALLKDSAHGGEVSREIEAGRS